MTDTTAPDFTTQTGQTEAQRHASPGLSAWLEPRTPSDRHLRTPSSPMPVTTHPGERSDATDVPVFEPRGESDPLDPEHFYRLTSALRQPTDLAVWVADEPTVITARATVDAALAAVDSAEAEGVAYAEAYARGLRDLEAAKTARVADASVTLPSLPSRQDAEAEADVLSRRTSARVTEHLAAVRAHDGIVRSVLRTARPRILAAFRDNVAAAQRVADEARAVIAADEDLYRLLDLIDGAPVGGPRETRLGLTTGWQLRAAVRRSGSVHGLGDTIRNAVTHPDLLPFWDVEEPAPVEPSDPAPAAVEPIAPDTEPVARSTAEPIPRARRKVATG